MTNVKIRLLADMFNLYHYDEDGIPIKKRGYKSYVKGDVVEVPDFVADRLIKQTLPGPVFTRRNAVLANSDEDPYKGDGDGTLTELAPGVSAFPEGDFGSTDVGGNLLSDPEGDLKEQRDKARVAELAPPKKEDKKPAQRPDAPAPTQNK